MRSVLSVAILPLLLAACASYDGRGLQPGVATGADVRALMGEPAAVHRGDAGEAWEYPRGPQGYHTFMVRLGADGRLAGIDQVFSERFFGRVVAGMGGDEVRRILGTPLRSVAFPARRERVWDYRWSDSPLDYTRYFHVVFDEAGRVKATLHTTEYLPSGTDSQN